MNSAKLKQRHTSCIHKKLHAGKWPDLMTSKPDALSTPRYHWTYFTGTTLADDIAQWSSSDNPVLICIIGTHWITTRRPLEACWKYTGYQKLFLQWHSNVHGGLISRHTGLPLNYHWLGVRIGYDFVVYFTIWNSAGFRKLRWEIILCSLQHAKNLITLQVWAICDYETMQLCSCSLVRKKMSNYLMEK